MFVYVHTYMSLHVCVTVCHNDCVCEILCVCVCVYVHLLLVCITVSTGGGGWWRCTKLVMDLED